MKNIIFLALALVFLGCKSSKEKDGIVFEADFRTTFDYFAVRENPLFDRSWHINSANDINVKKAWQQGYTGKGIKIAIIDKGFEIYHEDLRHAVIYAIDTTTGRLPRAQEHGTMCAGLAGARSNNVGSLGVAPASGLILIASSLSSDAERIKAFLKAQELGADVISCSWGTYHASQAVTDAITDIARNARGGRGAVFIFASGNDGKDLDASGIDDESEIEDVLGVGFVKRNGEIDGRSNYGSNVDLVAPGADILSTSYHFGYGTSDGSSFAAPQVAGAAAIILEKKPYLTSKEVRALLTKHAKKHGGGFSTKYGHGRLDVRRALNAE